MPYREDEQIGMLIGTNCTKAIKPCKVIPGGHSDPYRLILVGEFLEEVASPPPR